MSDFTPGLLLALGTAAATSLLWQAKSRVVDWLGRLEVIRSAASCQLCGQRIPLSGKGANLLTKLTVLLALVPKLPDATRDGGNSQDHSGQVGGSTQVHSTTPQGVGKTYH